MQCPLSVSLLKVRQLLHMLIGLFSLKVWTWLIAQMRALTDFSIDMLIGSDHYWDLVRARERVHVSVQLKVDLLPYRHTKMAWVLSGHSDAQTQTDTPTLEQSRSFLVSVIRKTSLCNEL